jgi:hypothetical protein
MAIFISYSHTKAMNSVVSRITVIQHHREGVQPIVSSRCEGLLAVLYRVSQNTYRTKNIYTTLSAVQRSLKSTYFILNIFRNGVHLMKLKKNYVLSSDTSSFVATHLYHQRNITDCWKSVLLPVGKENA